LIEHRANYCKGPQVTPDSIAIAERGSPILIGDRLNRPAVPIRDQFTAADLTFAARGTGDFSGTLSRGVAQLAEVSAAMQTEIEGLRNLPLASSPVDAASNATSLPKLSVGKPGR
jgi:hypothetical protein